MQKKKKKEEAGSLTGFQIVTRPANYRPPCVNTSTSVHGWKHAWLNIFWWNVEFLQVGARRRGPGIPQRAFQFPTLKLWRDTDCNTTSHCASQQPEPTPQIHAHTVLSLQLTQNIKLKLTCWSNSLFWFLWPNSCAEYVHMLHNEMHTQPKTIQNRRINNISQKDDRLTVLTWWRSGTVKYAW